MKKTEIAGMLGELSVLVVRDIERNTSIRIKTIDEMYELLMEEDSASTYESGIKTLERFVNANIKSVVITEKLNLLKEEILKSPIKEMRFGYDREFDFTKEELILNSEILLHQLKANQGMYSIPEISKIIGISADTIKTACQQERIINIRKVGNSWQVNLEECKKYWRY